MKGIDYRPRFTLISVEEAVKFINPDYIPPYVKISKDKHLHEVKVAVPHLDGAYTLDDLAEEHISGLLKENSCYKNFNVQIEIMGGRHFGRLRSNRVITLKQFLDGIKSIINFMRIGRNPESDNCFKYFGYKDGLCKYADIIDRCLE
ncbi:hypothetical protein HYX16_00955 [Candidatus Woesearchaeota archaeon]|nr:hypothetical protein [Candidatus Woesearchaeota archaeon]